MTDRQKAVKVFTERQEKLIEELLDLTEQMYHNKPSLKYLAQEHRAKLQDILALENILLDLQVKWWEFWK